LFRGEDLAVLVFGAFGNRQGVVRLQSLNMLRIEWPSKFAYHQRIWPVPEAWRFEYEQLAPGWYARLTVFLGIALERFPNARGFLFKVAFWRPGSCFASQSGFGRWSRKT